MYNGVYTVENYAYMHDTLIKWIKLHVSGVTLGDRLHSFSITHVAIYGANELGNMVCADITGTVRVEAYIDKFPQRYADSIDNIKVIGLERIHELCEDCYILITPEMYCREIMDDLLAYGIQMKRIISLSMLM